MVTADKERVIRELEELQSWLKHLQTVGFLGDVPEYRERENTVADALELLKADVQKKAVYYPKHLPRLCGNKRLKIRNRVNYSLTLDNLQFWECKKCGRKSQPGYTRREATENWNRMMEQK